MYAKLEEEDGKIVDVYLVPLSAITPGSPQVIVGTTKDNVTNVYVWEMNETVKPSDIVPQSKLCTNIVPQSELCTNIVPQSKRCTLI